MIDDARALWSDHVELARLELRHDLRALLVEVAAGLLGGLVALLGLALVCVALVPALAPWVASLAGRVAIAGVAYGLLGGVVLWLAVRRLRREPGRLLAGTRRELGRDRTLLASRLDAAS